MGWSVTRGLSSPFAKIQLAAVAGCGRHTLKGLLAPVTDPTLQG